jgi:hypothetical protein
VLDQGVCVQFVYGQIVCVCRLCGSAGWVCVRLWVCVCVCAVNTCISGPGVFMGTCFVYGDMGCLWGNGVFMGTWGVYGDIEVHGVFIGTCGVSWGHGMIMGTWGVY